MVHRDWLFFDQVGEGRVLDYLREVSRRLKGARENADAVVVIDIAVPGVGTGQLDVDQQSDSKVVARTVGGVAGGCGNADEFPV